MYKQTHMESLMNITHMKNVEGWKQTGFRCYWI